MNKKGGELVSDGLCGLGFILIPVFLSEERRYSGSLSLQRLEDAQIPSPQRGEGNQVPSPLRGEG